MPEGHRWVQASSLYVVATPIGNKSDWTQRAIEVLGECSWAACEDTRTSRQLLKTYEIDIPLISYHDHNEKQRALELLGKLKAGDAGALISDAGTPAISDPGFRLVRECRRAGMPVYTVPGASALTAALSISGLPTDRFFYAGFLPPKSAARRRFLEAHKESDFTVVLFESKHRIGKLLQELKEVMGEARVVSLSRELTKLHESSSTAAIGDVILNYESGSQKGEFVVIIAPLGYEL